MKKKTYTNKLSLNKKAISNLNSNQVKGGYTSGCTDGCSPFQTEWNCTGSYCSADCTNGASAEPVCTDQFTQADQI